MDGKKEIEREKKKETEREDRREIEMVLRWAASLLTRGKGKERG